MVDASEDQKKLWETWLECWGQVENKNPILAKKVKEFSLSIREDIIKDDIALSHYSAGLIDIYNRVKLLLPDSEKEFILAFGAYINYLRNKLKKRI